MSQATELWSDMLTQFPKCSNYRQWLSFKGSTTAAINRHFGPGYLHVDVVDAQWLAPGIDEMVLLDAEKEVWVREVVLYCHKKPWLWAKSVFPKDTLAVFDEDICTLTASLGEVLFKAPDKIKRSNFVYRELLANDPLRAQVCHRLPDLTDALWARRSRLELQGQPLLLTEVFLPKHLPRVFDKHC